MTSTQQIVAEMRDDALILILDDVTSGERSNTCKMINVDGAASGDA